MRQQRLGRQLLVELDNRYVVVVVVEHNIVVVVGIALVGHQLGGILDVKQ